MARQRIETAPEITIYDESFVIKAASGASAPLAEFKNSSGTVVGNIATTGTLNITSVTSGNVVPSTSNTYSLGAVNNVWKDIFVGPGSLYVNGQKVLQDESGVIIVSATVDNNLGLRTSGSGNIELDPTGTGVVNIKGPLVIQAATNITSADGNPVTFGGAINADTISSKTTNTDLSITANGTGKVYINDNSEVSGNLVVGGNLTVSGTTTTVNSETISLADNLIDLNSNFTTGTPTEDAGIRIMRGDTAAVQLRWNEGTDVWEFTNNGSTYNTITPLASPTFTGTVTIPSGASISGFAPLASPALTGTPTAPTAAALTNTTQVATTAFVTDAVATGVAGASIDSLDEITDVTITSASSGQFLKWNGTAWVNDAVPVINNIDDITGVTITAAANKDFLMYNGTAWVDSPITLGTDTTGSYVTSLVAGTGVTLANNSGESATPTVTVDTTVIAPLASPTFTGTPLSTTASAGTNTTQIATTAFVTDAVATGVAGAGAEWTTGSMGQVDGGPVVTSLVAENSSMGIYADGVYFMPNAGGTLAPNDYLPMSRNTLESAGNNYYLTDYWIPSAVAPTLNSNGKGISAQQILTRSIGIGYDNMPNNMFMVSSFYIAASDNYGQTQDVKIYSAGAFGIQPNTTFDGNVTISGDLTVTGAVGIDFSSDQNILANSIFG